MFIKKICATLVIIAVVEADMLPFEILRRPHPYKFQYNSVDRHGEQPQQEVGDGHNEMQGSYGFPGYTGFHRRMKYIADHAGFRPGIRNNEPGTANQGPAAVNIISSAHPYYGAGYGLGGAGLRGSEYGMSGIGLVRSGYGVSGTGFGGSGYGFDDNQGENEIGDVGVRRSLRLGYDPVPGYDGARGLINFQY